MDYVKDHDVAIVPLRETWLSDNEQNTNKVIGDITPDGYSFRNVARSGPRDGGVGLLFECVSYTLNTKRMASTVIYYSQSLPTW